MFRRVIVGSNEQPLKGGGIDFITVSAHIFDDEEALGQVEGHTVTLPAGLLKNLPTDEAGRKAAIREHVDAELRDVHAAWLVRLDQLPPPLVPVPPDALVEIFDELEAEVESHKDRGTKPHEKFASPPDPLAGRKRVKSRLLDPAVVAPSPVTEEATDHGTEDEKTKADKKP